MHKELNYTVFLEKLQQKNEEIENLKEQIEVLKKLLSKGKNRIIN